MCVHFNLNALLLWRVIIRPMRLWGNVPVDSKGAAVTEIG